MGEARLFMVIMTATQRDAWGRLSDAQLLEQCAVDTYRASGPGGQKRNKTSSAVRLRHLPSGLIVIAEESRSQHENRAKALKRLRQAFALKLREEIDAAQLANGGFSGREVVQVRQAADEGAGLGADEGQDPERGRDVDDETARELRAHGGELGHVAEAQCPARGERVPDDPIADDGRAGRPHRTLDQLVDPV